MCCDSWGRKEADMTERLNCCLSCGIRNDRFMLHCEFGSECALEPMCVPCFFPASATTWEDRKAHCSFLGARQRQVEHALQLFSTPGIRLIRAQCQPHRLRAGVPSPPGSDNSRRLHARQPTPSHLWGQIRVLSSFSLL